MIPIAKNYLNLLITLYIFNITLIGQKYKKQQQNPVELMSLIHE